MMKDDMRLLLHFRQGFGALLPEQVGKTLQALIVCLQQLDAPLSGMLTLVHTDAAASCQVEITDLHAWQDAAVYMTPTLCHARLELSNPEFGKAMLSGCITRHPTLTPLMIAGEQSVEMTVEHKLWRQVQPSLMACMQQLCTQQEITYAAIDRTAVAPASIYHANLRLLSNAVAAAAIDPESHIPGLYWAQYWSSDMLTEPLRAALLTQVTNQCRGAVVQQLGEGLWLQTSRSVSTDTAAAHRAVYDLVRPQTYEPDTQTLEKYRRLQPWLFDRFPIGTE